MSLTLSALVLSSQGLLAAAPQPTAAPAASDATLFQRVDTNQDGIVTRDEFSSHMKRTVFGKIDANHDKAITRDEWKATDLSPDATKRFDAIDIDGNGQVSILEFHKAADRDSNVNDLFDHGDKNHDGRLTSDEFPTRPVFRILSVQF